MDRALPTGGQRTSREFIIRERLIWVTVMSVYYRPSDQEETAEITGPCSLVRLQPP